MKHVGRISIFITGAVINLGVIIAFFAWIPNAEEAWVFYILAALWGIADAVWQTQINGTCGDTACIPWNFPRFDL